MFDIPRIEIFKVSELFFLAFYQQINDTGSAEYSTEFSKRH
jgi:hypothetical protein